MARLIAVSIDCRNEAARQTFEEIISRRREEVSVTSRLPLQGGGVRVMTREHAVVRPPDDDDDEKK